MSRPPRWTEWPLRAALPEGPEGLSALGDLREEFAEMSRRRPRALAVFWYWQCCLRMAVWYGWARARRRESRGEAVRAWLNEVRIASRTLRRDPRRNAVPVLVLAFGIGLSALALTLLRETLLASYPFPAADELHTLWATQLDLDRPQVSMSLAEIEDYRRESTVFPDIGVVRPDFDAAVTASGDADVVKLAFVNSGYFRVLGVPPALGRYFSAEEDVGTGAHPVIVISDRFRRARLPDVPDPLGEEIEISNMRFSVVGVAPPEFFGPETVASPADIWVPVTMSPPFLGNNIYENRAERVFWTVFRASSPGELERVRLEAAPVSARLAVEYATDHDGWGVRTVPLREFVDGSSREGAIRLVVAAAILVLLVSCVNVASLRLISAQQRTAETSIRLALGAGRGAMIRQHLAESLIVSTLAGAIGVALAAALVGALEGNVALPLPAHAEIGLDSTSMLIALALVLGTGVVVGLVPAAAAYRAGAAPSGLLDRVQGSRGGVGKATRRWVVAAEVAGTVVLLQIAFATLEGFRQVTRTPTGFETTGLLTLRLDLQDGRPAPSDSAALATYFSNRWERRRQLAVQFADRAPGLPGIDAAGVWGPSVLGESAWHARVIRGDLDPNDARNIEISQRHSITPGALAAAGIPIVAGRDLNRADATDSIPGVVVDEAFAEHYWPGESAIGRVFFTLGGTRQARVVGVSARARHRGRLSPENEVFGDIFFPYDYWPTPTASIIARGPGDARTRLGSVQALLAEIDPTVGIYDVSPMERRLERQESVIRLPAFVMSVFGMIAIVLAATGILAVVNHTIQTREQEIGLRRALGLDGARLFSTLLGDAVPAVVAGALVGAFTGAAAGSRLVTATTVGGAAIGMPWSAVAAALAGTVLVASVAGCLPVFRARRLSPARLLRDG